MIFNLGAVKLNVGVKGIKVNADRFTEDKNIGGDFRSNDIDAKYELLYDYADILEHSVMVGEPTAEASYANSNVKPKNKAHRDVKYWYHFKNTVIMGESVYEIRFNIRDLGKEQYQYLIEVYNQGDATKKQLQSIKRTPKGFGLKLSTATESIVHQNIGSVNSENSRGSERENTMTDQKLLEMASAAVAQTDVEKEYMKMYKDTIHKMSELGSDIEAEQEALERAQQKGDREAAAKAQNRITNYREQLDKATQEAIKLEESKPLTGIMWRIRHETEEAVLDALTEVRNSAGSNTTDADIDEALKKQARKYQVEIATLKDRLKRAQESKPAEDEGKGKRRRNLSPSTRELLDSYEERIAQLEARIAALDNGAARELAKELKNQNDTMERMKERRKAAETRQKIYYIDTLDLYCF